MWAKGAVLRTGFHPRARRGRTWSESFNRLGAISLTVGRSRGRAVRMSVREIAREWPLALLAAGLLLAALLSV